MAIASLKSSSPSSLNAAPQNSRARKGTGTKMGKALRRAKKNGVGLTYTLGPKILFMASVFTR
jgi:hypothetical protein